MTTAKEWVDVARLMPVKETAARLGMGHYRGRLAPCRLCGSDKDKGRPRGPIGVYRAGMRWICNVCKASGGSVDLASAYLFGEVIGPGSPKYGDLRAWYAAQGAAPAITEDYDEGVDASSLPRPPLEELRALLRASTPIGRSNREDILSWLDRKALRPKDAPCFVLPRSSAFDYYRLTKVKTEDGPKLWVSDWVASNFPVYVPLYDHNGALCNIRARPVLELVGASYGKTRTARGFSAKSALMCDPWQALRILRGEQTKVSTIVITEGDTDYLSFAQECRHDKGLAVFGIYSGAAEALKAVVDAGKWPEGALTVCATDPDTAGDRYSAKVSKYLSPFPVKRANLRGL